MGAHQGARRCVRMLEGARGLEEHSRIHGAVNDASMRMPTKPIDRGLVNPVVVIVSPRLRTSSGHGRFGQ
jgi:hypothetical protein